MDEPNRKPVNKTVDNLLDNITSSGNLNDGQFIPLGFPQSVAPTAAWPLQNQMPKNAYIHHFNMGNVHTGDTQTVFSLNQPPVYHQQVSYNYVQQPNMFRSDLYENHSDFHLNAFQHQNNDKADYRVQDLLYNPEIKMQNFQYINNASLMEQNVNLSNNDSKSSSNSSQFIDNLVGNWMPNTSGTYSPFGNVHVSNHVKNIFNRDHTQNPRDASENIEETNGKFEDGYFTFSRDNRKPRMVAEVKPMRPSYSYVLTKSAPQTVGKTKTDIKDTKNKKENSKRTLRNEKNSKNITANRSNGENKAEKGLQNNNKAKDKQNKEDRNNQLNRKWASLDNVRTASEDFKLTSEASDSNDAKNLKKNSDDFNLPKTFTKANLKKSSKATADNEDTDSNSGKTESFNSSKGSLRKNKLSSKQKNPDNFGNTEKPPGKRGQRVRKRENHVLFGFVGQKLKKYMPGWWKIFLSVCLWLVHLICDICSLSIHLANEVSCHCWMWSKQKFSLFMESSITIMKCFHFLTWLWEKMKRKNEQEEPSHSFQRTGLQYNIPMPSTGEEAMKRLLACKGKDDPYSILGVTPTCTDDDIKRYYKRQAVLVHPDKNQQPGAEEAFKILVHAFDMIGEPERRAAYDRGVAESVQVEQAWSKLNDLVAQFQQKVKAAANTIRCSACGTRHKRIKVDRPSYAARNCATCKIHHSAREGDIWAEARCFGFLWHYYACMEGSIYDITEWAGCQKESLKHLRPDSHQVQYRIALGKQNGQARRHNASSRNERTPDLESLLNSLYGNHDNSNNVKRRSKKANK